MSERKGTILPLVGGPWDGQELFVPTTPRMPEAVTFPVEWHDGTWDNAHWVWRYVLRGTTHGADPDGYVGFHLECVGVVDSPGLTQRERDEQNARRHELLVRTEP